jgi:hypothetical protein
MSMTVVIVAVAVIVLIGIVLMIALGRRGNRLRPLPEGARERYAASWRAIEARFVDSPQEAVREADQLVVALAHERGVPEDRVAARGAESTGDPESTTENLRKVMVQRRKAVEDLLGANPRELPGRQEVAS